MDQSELTSQDHYEAQRERWLGSIGEMVREANFQLHSSSGQRLFVDELVSVLDDGRDMLILGDSGSGKSSLFLKLLQQATRSSIVVRDSPDGDSEARAALAGSSAEVLGYTNRTIARHRIDRVSLIALEDFTVAPAFVEQLRSLESPRSRVGLLATSQGSLKRSEEIAESLELRDPITIGLSFRMSRGFFGGKPKHSYRGIVYGL